MKPIRTRARRVRSSHFTNGNPVQVTAKACPTEQHRHEEKRCFDRPGWVWLELSQTGFTATLHMSIVEAKAMARALDAAVTEAEVVKPCDALCYHCPPKDVP